VPGDVVLEDDHALLPHRHQLLWQRTRLGANREGFCSQNQGGLRSRVRSRRGRARLVHCSPLGLPGNLVQILGTSDGRPTGSIIW
jgi:hypothetical protein